METDDSKRKGEQLGSSEEERNNEEGGCVEHDLGEADNNPSPDHPATRLEIIDGERFWCVLPSASAITDPGNGRYVTFDDLEYWCVPYETAFPRRKY